MKHKRIDWMPDELTRVATRAFELRPMAEKLESKGWIKACHQAQLETIEPARQRNLKVGEHTLVKLIPLIKQLQDQSKLPQAAARVAPIQPTWHPPVDSIAISRDQELAARVAEAVVNLLEARLLKYLTTRGVSEAAVPSREASVAAHQAAPPFKMADFVERVESGDNQQLSERPPEAAARAEPIKLPRVAIVGFDSKEQAIIERTLVNRARLTFANPHHHSKSEKLVDKVAACDVIFVRIKYISHAHTQVLRRKLESKCRWLEHQPNAMKAIESVQDWLVLHGHYRH